MATSQDELEELQEETQEQDTQILSGDQEAELVGVEDETAETGPPTKKRKIRKEATILEREPGKSLLPFSRVQKIIKADKDIPMVARDAVFLISLATEEFIKRFCEAAQKVAEREKRATVQHRDIGSSSQTTWKSRLVNLWTIAAIVRKADEFLFLDGVFPYAAIFCQFLLFHQELIPWMAPDPAPKRQIGKSREGKEGTSVSCMLHTEIVWLQ
ncbi:Histone-like transcription factor (CBF/NF-Y) and archaeal histone domain containing protein [Amanita muscaria]